MVLQSVFGWWITKCGNGVLQIVLGIGQKNVTKWITKCVRVCKVWQGGLQSASGITKGGRITKWRREESMNLNYRSRGVVATKYV